MVSGTEVVGTVAVGDVVVAVDEPIVTQWRRAAILARQRTVGASAESSGWMHSDAACGGISFGNQNLLPTIARQTTPMPCAHVSTHFAVVVGEGVRDASRNKAPARCAVVARQDTRTLVQLRHLGRSTHVAAAAEPVGMNHHTVVVGSTQLVTAALAFHCQANVWAETRVFGAARCWRARLPSGRETAATAPVQKMGTGVLAAAAAAAVAVVRPGQTAFRNIRAAIASREAETA